MAWHYIENGQQTGPFDDARFNALVAEGRVKPDTLVWRDGMADWLPYATATSTAPAASAIASNTCAECGKSFPQEDLVQIGGSAVCATCKPIAVQKLKEGVTLAGEFRYAGFWIRFAAAFVDGLVLSPVTILYVFFFASHRAFADPTRLTGQFGMYVIIFVYSVFFIGKYGSTLGMMACGLRVVRTDGEKVSYARAVGRYFASILSHLPTIYIGTLMIAFDEKKRSLHDRICDTYVVYK